MIFFDTIVKRTANFPIQNFETNKNDLINFFHKDKLFKLSILISSISLYNDIEKNKNDKIKTSLLNYFIRAHLNSTPFGTFNSVGVLTWGNHTKIIKEIETKLSIKYDSSFLTSFYKYFESKKKDIRYCINPSIHFLHKNRISFYKSEISHTDKIEIKYVEIDYDENLRLLLDKFQKVTTLEQVTKEFISNGFERNQIVSYLLNAIDSGIIIDNFLFNPYSKKLELKNSLTGNLLNTDDYFSVKNKKDISSFITKYLLDQKKLKFEQNYPQNFFAINSFECNEGFLDIEIQEKIKNYIDFTIEYNSHSLTVNNNLNNFINLISEKYNDGFISLAKIFNPNSGINYSSLETSNSSKLDERIITKILASNDNQLILNLPINNNLERKKNNLPASFSILFEQLICKVTGTKVTYLQKLGCNSALNLVTRFSEVTKPLCLDIVNFEKEKNEDKIIADINCIGTFRSLNIASYNQLYDYCIPINTSFELKNNPILLSDIYIYLNGTKINLVSKKYKKEILPKLTTSLNPQLSESEIYKFLCDFEFYNQEIYGIDFNFNSYDFLLSYIPRIYLEQNVLLYPSQMLLIYDNQSLVEFKKNLIEKTLKYNFTKIIILIDLKGKLYLNTEDNDDLLTLYNKIKIHKKLYISEYLYHYFDPEIKNNTYTYNYSHELIVSVKNTHFERDNVELNFNDEPNNSNNNLPFISDWLYIELYRNSYANSEIIKYIYENIIINHKTVKFFGYVLESCGFNNILKTFSISLNVFFAFLFDKIIFANSSA